MKSRLFTVFILFYFVLPDVRAQEELPKIEASAKAFIEAFNAGDAGKIVSLFVPDGELVLSSGELVIGRENLLDHYTDVFADASTIKAALEAGSVRFLTDDLAMEDGTVHLTEDSGAFSSHFYTAVHAKQEDGTWLFASIRDETGDQTLPSEKLLQLDWLIGDWVIQEAGADTWISFSWSEDGPYIDARALTESPLGPATAATLRIGWNEKEESFVSWAFDAEGGFNQSEWSETGSEQWLLKTVGITASGETNTATQVLTRSASGESFSWEKRDQVIGGSVQDDRTIQAVKRPPEPAGGTTGDE